MNGSLSRGLKRAVCLALLVFAGCSQGAPASVPEDPPGYWAPTAEEAFVKIMRGDGPGMWTHPSGRLARVQPWTGQPIAEEERLQGHLVALGRGMCGQIDGLPPLDVAGYTELYAAERAGYLQLAAVGTFCKEYMDRVPGAFWVDTRG